jgi:hypothetical protein
MTKRKGREVASIAVLAGGGGRGTSSTDSKNARSSFLFLFHAEDRDVARGPQQPIVFFGDCIQCPDWLRSDPDSAKNVNPDSAKNVYTDSAKNVIRIQQKT